MVGSKGVEITVTENGSTVAVGGAKVEVSADGNTVTAYTNAYVQAKAGAAGDPSAKGTHIDVSTGFNAVVLNDVTIEEASDGHIRITTRGKTVLVKAPATNDSAEPQPGDRMPDGTIFA